VAHYALIALGANIGDPRSNIAEAIRRLRELFAVEKVSSLYKTRAVGGPDGQPDYLNAVARIVPHGPPSSTIGTLLKIELDMGRLRNERWGPRIIDLDLLDQDGILHDSFKIKLPHPRMHERAFVLYPLAEIEPQWRHPTMKLTALELAENLAEEDRAVMLGREDPP